MAWYSIRIGLLLALVILHVGCIEPPHTSVEPRPAAVAAPMEPSIHKTRADPGQLIVCPGAIEPSTLDPSRVVDSTTYEIDQHIFNKLVTTDNEGRIVPDLAIAWKRIDPRTTQFKLRKGVNFHNGEPFNAQAVKFSVEHMRNLSGRVFLKPIAYVDIVDHYTVNVVSSFSDGLLLQRLSFLPFILPPQHYDKPHFGRQPIGTGPYKFERWETGGQIVLVKNQQYWEPGIPKLSHLIFKFLPVPGYTNRELLAQLFAGRLDLLKQSPGTKTLDVQSNAQTKLIKMRSTRCVIILLNPRKPPFSDIRMRQAVAHAIDKDLLIKLAVKGNGRKIPFLSSDIDFGHNGELKPYPFDLSKARALVKESGYSDGVQVRGFVKNESEVLAQVLARFLKDIGIDLAYRTVSPQEMATIAEDLDMAIYVYHNPFMHATFLLNQFFQDNPMVKASSSYPQGFDAIYERMITTLDPAAQAQLSCQLERMAYDTYLIIPLFQKIETYGAARDLVYRPSISGFLNLTEAYFK